MHEFLQSSSLRDFFDAVEGGVYVVAQDSYTLLYTNAAAEQMVGKNAIGQKCHKTLWGLDAPCPDCLWNSSSDGAPTCRRSLPEREYCLARTPIVWEGLPAVAVRCTDITKQKETQKRLESQAEQLSLYHLTENAGVYRVLIDGVCTLLYANDRFFQIVGFTEQEFQRKLENRCVNCIFPDDRAKVWEAISNASKNDRSPSKWTMRIVTGEEEQRYIQVTGSFRKREDGFSIMEGSVIDVTEQKKTELALLLEKQKIDMALRGANIFIWEYDIHRRISIQQQKVMDQYHLPEVLENIPESIIASGVVHPDSVENYREFYRKIDRGEPEAETQIRMCDRTNRDMWMRMQLRTMYDDSGKAVRAIGFCSDITAQVEAQQKYEEFKKYRETVRNNTIASFRMNLTTNWCGDGESEDPSVLEMNVDNTVDGTFEYVYKRLPSEKELAYYKTVFSRTRLLELFAEGTTSPSLEYQYCVEPGKPKWLRARVDMQKNPVTGDVEALMYAFDIDEEKTNEQIIHTVATTEHDYLALIYLNTDDFRLFTGKANNTLLPSEGFQHGYIQATIEIDRACVHPDDTERCIGDTLPDQMRKNLAESPTFSAVYRVYDKAGELRHKKMQYTWLNETLGQVIMTRSDVTDVVVEQMRQQERLKQALSEAEQASNAKTDFLSRMSHDIRTPMNAIIGMTEIARDRSDNPPETADCLEKIHSSSHFLLGLINDVLDMSKIESGVLTLFPEPYVLDEFKKQIRIMIQPLCEQKGLSFRIETNVDGSSCVLADKVRFNQIFFNLLSNSVKYTPAGGQILLRIEHTEENDRQVHMRITVTDTGIGISREFQAHMFEPFSQEDLRHFRETSGSGLGLSIVKSLVELMHGTISVQSAPGSGSTFCVELELPHVSSPDTCNPRKIAEQFDLRGRQILLCEDHPINAQITVRLLEKVGAITTVAQDGRQGTELFAASPPGTYDAVLMDIRMPNMDGLEATQAIRAMDRADAGTIPIIAMTANAFDDDRDLSRKAGLNAHLSKPIEPRQLYSVLARYLPRSSDDNNNSSPSVSSTLGGSRI